MYVQVNIGIIVALIFSVVFVVSAGIFFFTADVAFWWKARKIRKIEREQIEPLSSLDEFESSLLHASIMMIEGGKKVAFPSLRGDTFVSRTKYFYKTLKKDSQIDGGDETIFHLDWSECGWIAYAIAESGVDLQYLQRMYSEKILPLPIRMINHSQLGMFALFQYDKTGDIAYKQYADKLYSFLLQQDSEYGILYRQNSPTQIVDVIGMAVPFLVEYGTKFYDIVAVRLAESPRGRQPIGTPAGPPRRATQRRRRGRHPRRHPSHVRRGAGPRQLRRLRHPPAQRQRLRDASPQHAPGRPREALRLQAGSKGCLPQHRRWTPRQRPRHRPRRGLQRPLQQCRHRHPDALVLCRRNGIGLGYNAIGTCLTPFSFNL